MICFPRLGKIGRIGNQLWQVASTIGMAEKAGVEAKFPDWGYKKYFTNFTNISAQFDSTVGFPVLREPHFSFSENFWKSAIHEDIAIEGYFQSEKYFEHCKDKIKATFEFTDECKSVALSGMRSIFQKRTIGVHIRRGDYVGNPNYVNLPISYYITAISEFIPNWRDCNIIFFSDDIDYCKFHFSSLKNTYFAKGESDIHDLALLSMCDDFVLSNSTFAWWGAWLGEKDDSVIVRPSVHFAGRLERESDIKDYYPDRWTAFDKHGQNIDLKDVTFMIPVSYDHEDRKQNLDLCVAMLKENFDTTIVIGENGTPNFSKFNYFQPYRKFEYRHFHRTKMLNVMADEATTEYVANYDCDVFLSPGQIFEAVTRLREGDDVVYPYCGDFAHVDRVLFYNKLKGNHDLYDLSKRQFRETKNSRGGAIFLNKKSYFSVGGENEKFVSHGPEDSERWLRYTKVGLKVSYVPGKIYHLEHWRGINSNSDSHPHGVQNREEYEKIRTMPEDELKEYIKTWPTYR